MFESTAHTLGGTLSSHRTRALRAPAVLAFAGSALALAAYPILRPWGPETGLEGASDFASAAWPIAHLLGMIGFVTLALGLRALATMGPNPWPPGSVRRSETLAWLAVAFLLPFYGGEAFGLQAVGQYAVEAQDPAVLSIADTFRNGPLALTTFGIGLLLLLVVGVRIAVELWGSGPVARLGGLLVGAGLVTYLPQFYGTPAVRIAHGIILAAGLLLVALAISRQAGRPQVLRGDPVERAGSLSLEAN